MGDMQAEPLILNYPNYSVVHNLGKRHRREKSLINDSDGPINELNEVN